ncbi:hypothetical protein J6590_034040 [Homalodisca vitripennis]|nr:hypothetical protein J6590_034040 [Homalodisca vitripennis]
MHVMDLLYHSSPLMGRYSIVRFIHSYSGTALGDGLATSAPTPYVYPGYTGKNRHRRLTDRFTRASDSSLHFVHLASSFFHPR